MRIDTFGRFVSGAFWLANGYSYTALGVGEGARELASKICADRPNGERLAPRQGSGLGFDAMQAYFGIHNAYSDTELGARYLTVASRP
jgi:hypothetical protein